MKLSDFLLFPTEVTSVDDNIDLVVYDSDYVEDPQVGKYLKMLVNADSENEVRMILKLIWDEFRDGNLAIDEKVLVRAF